MGNNNYKKYTEQAKRGNRGETFFESLISEYSLAHHIVAPKDIGIDYICQWVYENKPSVIFYAVQIKTFSKRTVQPKFIEVEKNGFNKLEKYRIENSNLRVDEKTFHYWQTFGMPVYLFAICDSGEQMDCYYKRYTPHLTKKQVDIDTIDFYLDYYKVNKGTSFKAFALTDRKAGGFTRDLFVDYIRYNYSKGSLVWINPRSIGLNQFPNVGIFRDLFGIYKPQILGNYKKLKRFLRKFYPNDV